MARVVTAADTATLERRTRDGFRRRFGRDALLVATAPGRANLIGEHTDYNEGFVLPFAIARRTAVAAAARGDRMVCVASAGAAGFVSFDLDALIQRGEPGWGDYVRGVVAESLAVGIDPGGFDAWVDSDVPAGAGLSSSAALEVALCGVVEQLTGCTFDVLDKARLCRRAEQAYAGVPCGIMDQMASVLAAKDSLVLLDCRDLSWSLVALPAGEVRLLLVDSGLPHDLGQGEFARRVEQCEEAARAIGVSSLREAAREQAVSLADPLLRRRALHVVDENARVLTAVDAIRMNDWSSLGRAMNESHASMRDLYEVSCPKMDELVAELHRAGALGARMTGGGFGGCAIGLFPAGALLPDFASCADTPSDG